MPRPNGSSQRGRQPAGRATSRARTRSGSSSENAASSSRTPRKEPARRASERSRPRAAAAEVIFGRNAVLEAVRAGRVRRVLVADGLEPDPRVGEIARLAPVERVSRERLALLAPGNHQGVAAWLEPRKFIALRALLSLAPRLLLALDGVLD